MQIAVIHYGLCSEQMRRAFQQLALDFPFSAITLADMECIESAEVAEVEIREKCILYTPSYVAALSDEEIESVLMRAAGMHSVFLQSKSRILACCARRHGIDVLDSGCVAGPPDA